MVVNMFSKFGLAGGNERHPSRLDKPKQRSDSGVSDYDISLFNRKVKLDGCHRFVTLSWQIGARGHSELPNDGVTLPEQT